MNTLQSFEKVDLKASLKEKLANSKYPLILGVWGGNDTVSSLILKKQLEKEFWFNPVKIDIMWILPDCLDYHCVYDSWFPLISVIGPDTKRSVQGKMMDKFPEKILREHGSGFWIERVMGISMSEWTVWITDSLLKIVNSWRYDLILACDIGGDFIATPENHHVLSPMMDSYMLVSLKEIQKKSHIPFVFGIFGLWTDGETPPQMLQKALLRIEDKYEWKFKTDSIIKIADFYREYVECVRYSRTADYTIREITWEWHSNPASFRARFHVTRQKWSPSEKYYWYFLQQFDEKYYGSYYLFDDLTWIENPYAIECGNGIEWFLKIQDTRTKVNCELNGQAYMDISKILRVENLSGVSLFFWTPSHKFDSDSRAKIVDDVIESIRNKVYDYAFVFSDDIMNHTNLESEKITDHIRIIWSNPKMMAEIISKNINI
ncbi:MAG: hypothetical protein ACD_3C00169G0005 [uncultured bacterium (gcode 4)]|uniref:Uncharacterized protein n=1 Tax=uncultured bacterium (gcode 4) TaxID=1234023 RepID=K2GWJ6_9BACT|nr:MAG: hypothetical protein ACD_3C00169G0005 [uncultured bacterium (gcode 4)]